MARNNPELSRGLNTNGGSTKNSRTTNKSHSTSPKYFKSISPPLKHHSGDQSSQRLSPSVRVSSPPSGSYSSSPRTSPGLLAGHYAGCKFTEPPLPSALPAPPQHWMQAPHVVLRPFISKQEPEQLTQQLKVLLKVQA